MFAKTPKTINSFIISLGVDLRVSARSRMGIFSRIFTSSKACSSSTGSGSVTRTDSLTVSGFLVSASRTLGFSLSGVLGFSFSGGFSSCFIIFRPSFFPGFASTFVLLSSFLDLTVLVLTVFTSLIFFSGFSSLASTFFILIDLAWVFAVVIFTFEGAFIFIFVYDFVLILTSSGSALGEVFGEKMSRICCAASSSTELI